LGAYWAALMVSRIMLSRVVLRLGAHRAVLGGALVAGCGVLGVAAAQNTAMALGAIVVTGVALAGVFPSVLGIAGGAFREHSGTVFGILFTVALSGGMTMPWAAGHLAAASGLRSVFVLVAVNFAAIAILARVARAKEE
jgi:fucose permease